MTDLPKTLEVNQGSTRPWRLVVLNQNSQYENTDSVAQAAFVVKTHAGATSAIVEFSVVDGNLEIVDLGERNEFECQLSQSQADALIPGVHVGQFSARFGDTDWRFSDPVFIKIVGQIGKKDPE